LLDKLKVEPL